MTVDPKSTLAPTVLGATVWVVAAGLGKKMFHLGDIATAVLALVLSGLFALLIVARMTDIQLWERPVYWLLNTAFIATMNLGTAGVVETVQTPGAAPTPTATSPMIATQPAAPTPSVPPLPPAPPRPVTRSPGPQPPAPPAPSPTEGAEAMRGAAESAPRAVLRELGKKLKRPLE